MNRWLTLNDVLLNGTINRTPYIGPKGCSAPKPALDERDILIAMEILRSQGGVLASCEEYHISAVTTILANNSHIAIDFTPGRFQGDLLLFISTLDRTGLDRTGSAES